MNQDKFHDSAGVPWQGRSFQVNSWAGDDGSCPRELAELLAKERVDTEALCAALGNQRLLIPLLATLGEGEVGQSGLLVDKSADLAIVAVGTPDGKTAIPAFTSATEMAAWNSAARPVPVDARKVALACASEGHERLVIDPAGRAVVLRRPALAALAQGFAWQPPERNPEVLAHLKAVAAGFPEILSIDLRGGDPDNNLTNPELQIQLGLRPRLNPEELKQLLTKFTSELQSPKFHSMVDSITLKLV